MAPTQRIVALRRRSFGGIGALNLLRIACLVGLAAGCAGPEPAPDLALHLPAEVATHADGRLVAASDLSEIESVPRFREAELETLAGEAGVPFRL